MSRPHQLPVQCPWCAKQQLAIAYKDVEEPVRLPCLCGAVCLISPLDTEIEYATAWCIVWSRVPAAKTG